MLVPKFSDTEDADTAYSVAWTCAVAPDALTDLTPALALAERAVKLDSAAVKYAGTLGALHYRAGHFDQARTTLEAAYERQTPADAPLFSPAYLAFFLALTHHQLGHSDQAQEWFDKGCESADPQLNAARDQAPVVSWNRRATLKLLRDEAAKAADVSAIPSGAPD